MSTDQTFADDVQEVLSFENAPKAPRFQPAFAQKAVKNVFDRLRWKKSKAKIFMLSIKFAGELLGYQMTGKPLQKSVKMQYRISTRAARAAIRAAKPKRHRRRS